MFQRRIARALSFTPVVLAVSSLPIVALGEDGGNVGKNHQIIHFSGGQTIIAFTDIRNDHTRRVYAQKLDANGVAQWRANVSRQATPASHPPGARAAPPRNQIAYQVVPGKLVT